MASCGFFVHEGTALEIVASPSAHLKGCEAEATAGAKDEKGVVVKGNPAEGLRVEEIKLLPAIPGNNSR